MAIATNNLIVRQEIKDHIQAIITALSNTAAGGYGAPWNTETNLTFSGSTEGLSGASYNSNGGYSNFVSMLDTISNYRNIPNLVSYNNQPIMASELMSFIKEVFRRATKLRLVYIYYYCTGNAPPAGSKGSTVNYSILKDGYISSPSFPTAIQSNTLIVASVILSAINDIRSISMNYSNSALGYTWQRCHGSCHQSCACRRGRR